MSNNKRKALGKGLSAILSSPDTDITSKDISGDFVVGAVADVPIGNVDANPFQPREHFDQEALMELSESIKKQGVIQPITVRKLGYDRYQLISGERRLRASKLAGLTVIPAYIRVANDEQMLEMALVENIQRQDLNPIEVAITYQRLMEECNLTKEQLGISVGKNRTTITNYLRLLALPIDIQSALRLEKVSIGQVRPLISIEDEQLQLLLFHEVLTEQLSARAVEKKVKELTGKISVDQIKETNNQSAEPKSLPVLYEKIKERLSEKLETKIEIKRNRNGKGNLVIPFRSDKDFERILFLLELK